MNHKEKQRLARKNQTQEELINKVSIFQTNFWTERSMQIKERVKKTEETRRNKKSTKNLLYEDFL